MASVEEADIDALREKYLNHDFDEKDFTLSSRTLADHARMCGETAPRFLDEEDPDFQASPTFVCSLAGRRMMPEDFPRFGFGMDAGKAVECLAPVRPGILTGRTHVHDIYTKTGRSGRMLFAVSRVEFYDEDGLHVANADTRIVMRDRS